MRSYIYNGDVSALASIAGKLSVGIGIQSLSNALQNASHTVYPQDKDVSPLMTVRSANTHPTYGNSFSTNYTTGGAPFPYDTVPVFESRIEDYVGGIESYIWHSIDWVEFQNMGLWMSDYGSGTIKTGYTYADQSSTVIGAMTYGLAVDAAGYVAEIKNIPAIFTGTAIVLDNTGGNYQTASANSATTYTATGTTLGAYARILINAASQPSSTGTLITGSTFQVNTDMYLVTRYNGTRIEYWFEEI